MKHCSYLQNHCLKGACEFSLISPLHPRNVCLVCSHLLETRDSRLAWSLILGRAGCPRGSKHPDLLGPQCTPASRDCWSCHWDAPCPPPTPSPGHVSHSLGCATDSPSEEKRNLLAVFFFFKQRVDLLVTQVTRG